MNSFFTKCLRLALLAAATAGWTSVGLAQSDAVWNGGTGSWNDGSMWTPNGVPNGTFNVFIDDGDSMNSIVDTPSSTTISVDSLTIDLGDTLRINNNTNFNIVTDAGRPQSGMIFNDGSLILENAGSLTQLLLSGDVLLSGTGTLTLDGTTTTSRITGGGHLTNMGNVIQGFGQIGINNLQFTNTPGSTVDANVSGTTLVIDPNASGVVNSGIFTASNGGNLVLSTGDFDNASGLIEAMPDSQVSFSSTAVVSGGLLNTIGNGQIQVPQSTSAVVVDVTNLGNFEQHNNSDLYLSGSIENQGSFNVINAGTLTDLVVDTTMDLSGQGTVTLSGTTNNSRILDQSGANGVLTNFDNVIEGRGQIGVNTLQLINQPQGLVDANDSTGSLVIDPPTALPMINMGIYKASNMGHLGLSTNEIDNTGGLIAAEDMSTVTLSAGVSISGGTLRAEGSGEFNVGTSQSARVANVTIEGLLTSKNNTDFRIDGTIVNQGEINMANEGSLTDIFVDSITSFEGGGTITLSGTTDNSRITDPSSADGVVTNVDNLIQGRGRIGVNTLQFINEMAGVVNANDSTGSLTLDPRTSDSFINRGIMTASSAGILNLSAGSFDNMNGLIRAETGSTVNLISNAAITGGTLRSEGTGDLNVPASNTARLTDVTIEGLITSNNNTDFYISGNIDNQGELKTINAGSLTDIFIDTMTSFGGGGTITLDGTTNNSRILDPGGADGTATNVDNLIQGRGQIGVNSLQFTNEVGGVIDANHSDGPITLDPRDSDPMINRGLMTASDGGTLVLTSGPFDNSGGLIRAEDGSTVTLNSNSEVTGGTLKSEGTGNLNVGTNQGVAIIDAMIEGKLTQNNNSDLLLEGTIDNQGLVEVNSLGSFTDIFVNSPVLVSGPGEVSLNSSIARIVGTGDIEFLGGVLSGIGQVNVPCILNGAKVVPGQSPGTLTFNNSVQMMNQSELEVEVMGTAAGEFDVMDVNGSLTLAGSLIVDVTGFEPDPSDTFAVVDATSLTGAFDDSPNGGTAVTTNRKAVFTVNYGPGSAFDPNQVVLSDYRSAIFLPNSFNVVRGNLTSGTVSDLLDSDNNDVSVQRNPVQATGVVEIEIESQSPVQNPTEMEFTLESAAFFRSTIVQTIEFFDYDAGSYVQVDTRNASRFSDSVAMAVGTGDLSRFVDDSTGAVKARIVYTSAVRRQSFSTTIDQAFWFIR